MHHQICPHLPLDTLYQQNQCSWCDQVYGVWLCGDDEKAIQEIVDWNPMGGFVVCASNSCDSLVGGNKYWCHVVF